MRDIYDNHAPTLTSPAIRHFRITPGANDLDPRPKAIFCDGDGTAAIVDEAGNSVTWNLLAGQYVMLRAVKVTAATATLISLV